MKKYRVKKKKSGYSIQKRFMLVFWREHIKRILGTRRPFVVCGHLNAGNVFGEPQGDYVKT